MTKFECGQCRVKSDFQELCIRCLLCPECRRDVHTPQKCRETARDGLVNLALNVSLNVLRHLCYTLWFESEHYRVQDIMQVLIDEVSQGLLIGRETSVLSPSGGFLTGQGRKPRVPPPDQS